jgi:TRAP-type C4-dicarboxylate transport system permease small subunit
MSETAEVATPPEHRIGRALYFCSYVLAMIGGILMVGLTALVVTSVAGRWLFSTPIFGDFEMVALGTAISVFLFLPYCHINRGNVIVDVFLSWAPRRVQSFFDILGSVALGAIAGMLTWRMLLGGLGMFEYNEVTYILALPIWWAFPFAVVSMALLTVSCIYTAAQDLARTIR